MLKTLVDAARRLLGELGRGWLVRPGPAWRAIEPSADRPELALRPVYRPLDRVVLTDEVSRTLFEEYEAHRQGPRGEEETGWVLLGHRREKEAVVLATLPAGARSEAGIAHVRFNSEAQAVASRMVRRIDRQLGIVGIVHTHPGSLRHPSGGDYDGDRQWVRLLRGGEGVFGIGTADAKKAEAGVALQPKPHSQCFLGLRFTWYALAEEDRRYRPLPVSWTIGPDLARPLHEVWPTLEIHAERLESLYRRLANLQVEAIASDDGPMLQVVVPLDEPLDCLRVVLRGERIEYYLIRKGKWLASESPEPRLDRGVYLLLAALSGSEHPQENEKRP